MPLSGNAVPGRRILSSQGQQALKRPPGIEASMFPLVTHLGLSALVVGAFVVASMYATLAMPRAMRSIFVRPQNGKTEEESRRMIEKRSVIFVWTLSAVVCLIFVVSVSFL
jgi:hypothetical protein